MTVRKLYEVKWPYGRRASAQSWNKPVQSGCKMFQRQTQTWALLWTRVESSSPRHPSPCSGPSLACLLSQEGICHQEFLGHGRGAFPLQAPGCVCWGTWEELRGLPCTWKDVAWVRASFVPWEQHQSVQLRFWRGYWTLQDFFLLLYTKTKR